MSSIIKGLIDESESVSVIYIDGKPSTKYTNAVEAKKDADRLRVKFPNKKIEVKQEIDEAREMSPDLRAAQKNLVDLSTGEVRRREDAKKAAAKREREYEKQAARDARPKKPSLDQIWQKVEHAISNYFPDGDPTDYLNPYMERNNLTWDDITKAAKKNGYNDLWDYWNTLSQDIENDAYYDWMAAKRPETPENPLSKDAADIQHRNWVAKKNPNIRARGFFMEDPDYPAVGYQEGGWRQVKLKPAGQLDEFDSFDNATSYRVHPAGELDEGDVVPFKKKKTEYDKYKDAFSKQHDDEHRHGVGWIECDYCGDVNCDYDCDGSQADGELEEDTSYGGGMGQGGYAGQSYRKFKPKMAGTNMKKSSILKGITGESE